MSMTPPDPPIRERSARFGALLRQAMTRRGMTGVALSRLTGIDAPDVSDIRHGHRFPSLDRATRLADALDWPGLSSLMVELRTSVCAICGASFVDPSRDLRQRYCSDSCASTSQDRRRRGSRTELGIVEAHRLRDHQEAVAAYCRGCEPEGLCRDAACPLRPVSPLPLADRRARVA